MNLANDYVTTFIPVNDAERIAAIASSNINCLAVGGDILHSFRGPTTMGQNPNVSTPNANTPSMPGAGVASSQASAGQLYVAIDYPISLATSHDDGGQLTSLGTGIYGTTGSSWQPVGLAVLGNLTAF